MKMNELLGTYDCWTECIYKDERYSVRDNGAILRHPKRGKSPRRLDNVWTFGKPNIRTGYMEYAGKPVHRIVAYAFLGEPPSQEYVVDHIDTNRQNNRKENLRWLTRLENILKNPITVAKIEAICGSVEAFLENPSLLKGHESENCNFTWMRSVTREEAERALEHFMEWAKEHPISKGKGIGEWIYKDTKKTSFQEKTDAVPYVIQRHTVPKMLNNTEIKELQEMLDVKRLQRTLPQNESLFFSEKEMQKPVIIPSLTENAVQSDWKTPTEFPCCPPKITSTPIKDYEANLEIGKVFNRNKFGENRILAFKNISSNCLYVMSNISIGFKEYAIARITFENGKFVHESVYLLDSGDEPYDFFEKL